MNHLKVLYKSSCDFERTGKSESVFLTSDALRDAVTDLFEQDYFLEDITGMDTADGLVSMYHFSHYERAGRVALHVVVPHEAPEIPSISDIFNGAEWHERECHDFFGIKFRGNHDLSPLLLPGTMESHPLLKAKDVRIPLIDFFDPGKVSEKDPGFNLLEKPTPPDDDGKEA